VAEGRARIVFHHLAFLGQESLWAAEAAECAREQGRFWDFHDALFAAQAGENRGAFGRDTLRRLAAELGLDTAAFNACVDSGRAAAAIQAEVAAGRAKGVRVTPTLFVAGQKIEGVPDFEQVRRLVEAATGRGGGA
jgi:protein-disulfide isomerase